MFPVKIASIMLVVGVGVSIGGVRPTPTATPTPRPNILARAFLDVVVPRADRAMSGTTEWLQVHAGAVVADWATVHAAASKLTERFPGSCVAQIALAVGLEGKGQSSEAKAALLRAVEIHPKNDTAWGMLARLDVELGDLKGAIAALEEVNKFLPGDFKLLMALGATYREDGDHGKALSAFEQATGVSPEDLTAWIAYAEACSASNELNRFGTALNQLRLAHPQTATSLVAKLPPPLVAVLPTPIPPTPRPTAGADVPRIIMAGVPVPTGSHPLTSWEQAAVAFESKVATIAPRVRPLADMLRRYNDACSGKHTVVTGNASEVAVGTGTATAAATARSSRGSSVAVGYVNWASVWSRSASWSQVTANETTPECRGLASDIGGLAAEIRAAVEEATQSTKYTGMSDGERQKILQKYNLFW